MRATTVPGPRPRAVASRPAAGGRSPQVLHLYLVWAIALFDFQFFLAEKVAQPLVYLVYLGYPPLLLMMALQGPAIMATAKRWVWFPPLFTLLIIGAINVFFANNQMLAKAAFQNLLIFYALALATAVYVKTARDALPIIVMLFAQFAWYGLFAQTKGLVPWHPTLANYDGFGGLVVQGAGLCYWFAAAARSRKMKYFLYALAGYCVLGVVASFARAAFLSLIALVGYVWLRSPRKMATAGGIVVAGLVVVGAASLIFEPGFFWKEITSAFEEGASEGTGAQRWELWKVGFKVWMQHPILGVGGGNFGAFAASHFRFGELEAFPSPSMLYGYNLHNAYMQILSEFGILGILAFGWAIWDFQKRNRALREPAAMERWAAQTGGAWNLRYLAFGLEAANMANALCAIFYASLFMPGFYTIWIANRMLWSVTRGPEQTAPAQVRRPMRARRTHDPSRGAPDPSAA
jgi:O-antigen ligase